MQLVDHQDDVAASAGIVDDAFHPAFKLAAELGAGDHGRHVEQIDFLVQQLGRDLAGADLDRETFGDGGLADAGFAQQNRVVLGAAIEDLDDPRQFFLAGR